LTQRRITAFGSSRILPSDPGYADVVAMATRLAQAGWNALTGGHQGMMAAFSEGIHQGGGHVRGITLERFPTPPGNHLSEEVRALDFFQRMQTLIEETDAYIVLPGGLGTLAELAMSWDLLAIGVLEPRPLILYGETWPPLIEAIRSQCVMSVDDAFSIVTCCRTTDEVLALLEH